MLLPSPSRGLSCTRSIGNQRLIRTELITTDKVRLRITQAAACPALSEFGLYAEPEQFRPPPFHWPLSTAASTATIGTKQ